MFECELQQRGNILLIISASLKHALRMAPCCTAVIAHSWGKPDRSWFHLQLVQHERLTGRRCVKT